MSNKEIHGLYLTMRNFHTYFELTLNAFMARFFPFLRLTALWTVLKTPSPTTSTRWYSIRLSVIALSVSDSVGNLLLKLAWYVFLWSLFWITESISDNPEVCFPTVVRELSLLVWNSFLWEEFFKWDMLFISSFLCLIGMYSRSIRNSSIFNFRKSSYSFVMRDVKLFFLVYIKRTYKLHYYWINTYKLWTNLYLETAQ